MKELKTLKDLEKDCHWQYDTLRDLKQAGREWVKELKEKPYLIDANKNQFQDTTLTISWIKHFFNLEDDKKDQNQICK